MKFEDWRMLGGTDRSRWWSIRTLGGWLRLASSLAASACGGVYWRWFWTRKWPKRTRAASIWSSSSTRLVLYSAVSALYELENSAESKRETKRRLNEGTRAEGLEGRVAKRPKVLWQTGGSHH